MIIDFHTHIFPDSLAQRAYEALTKNALETLEAIDGDTNNIKELTEYLLKRKF